MSSTVLGLLDFYCSESDSSLYSTFQLKKGETTIGSSSKCDITLAYPNISAQHCKITLLDNSEFSIEDLGSTNGIYRLTLDCSQQLLRPNKEYELIPDRPFYIANRYKCVFKLAQLKEKMEVEEKEEPSEIKLENNEDNLIDSSLLLTSRSALKKYREEMKRVLESERKSQSQARRQSSPKGKEDTKKKQSSKKSEKKTGKPDENLSKSKSSSEKMTVEQEITSEVERKKQEANNSPKARAKSQKSSTKDSSSKGIEAQEKDVIKTKSSEGKHARSKSKADFADNEESKDDNKKTKIQLKKKSGEKLTRENTPKKGKEQSKKGSKEKDKISPSSTKGSEDNDQPSLGNSSEKKKGKRRGNKEELNQFEKASTSSKKIRFEDKPVDASPRKLRSSLKSPSRVSSVSKQSLSSKSSLSKSSNEKGNWSTSKWNGENGFETPKRDVVVSKKNAPQVAFSGIEETECDFKEDKKKLGNLGVKIIDEKDQKFTVLVMKKFKRTMKFLIALSRGIDIVDYRWVKDSIKEGKSLPVENYIYGDNPAEIKFKFNLMESLEKAKQRKEGLLEGYRLYIPGDIKPSYDEVRLVIESTGGSLIRTKPVSYKDNVLILLNTYDEKNLKYFEELGYSPYTTELVFSGILKQKMDFGSNTL